MSPFTPRDWRDSPDHSTPITVTQPGFYYVHAGVAWVSNNVEFAVMRVT